MEAIAQYGSSDEEHDVDHTHPTAPTLHQNPSTSDPPVNTNTQGRIRRFPHVPGNFAVHVFINVPTPEPCRRPLENLLQQIKLTFPDFAPVDSLDNNTDLPLLAQPSYHVSFSRTLPIRLPSADPLLTSLRNNLHPLKRFSLRIHPVLEVFLNDDQTRTFLALKVTAKPVLAVVQLLLSPNNKKLGTAATAAVLENSDPLLQAIDAVSDAFEMEELQRFYDTPRPHISLGWLLGDQSAALSAAVTAPPTTTANLGEENTTSSNAKIDAALSKLGELQWEVEPEGILCRIGQATYSVWKSKQ